MSQHVPPLMVDIEDLGATQVVTLLVGNTPVIRYLPGSRYLDSALSDAEELIADALREIIGRALYHRNGTQISAEGFADDAYYEHMDKDE